MRCGSSGSGGDRRFDTTTLGAVDVRRRAAAVALVVTAPLLSSCGVNFGAQTDKVYNPSAGVDDRSGNVNVLNALVVSGSTGSGTVIATLVNENQTKADQLTSVAGAGADTSLEVTPGGTTDIPPAGLLNLATDGQIFVQGTSVVPGGYTEVTFSFANAKAITVDAPVVGASNPVYAGVALPSPAASASPPASPSASSGDAPTESPSESPGS